MITIKVKYGYVMDGTISCREITFEVDEEM
jgi:hypothetical protein